MFTLIINHQADTLIMELPCGRIQMAEHLASIGVVTPAHEIKCISEDDDSIEVKIYGNSEFEKRLAAFISPSTTLSVFNSFCEMYQNIPYEDKLKVQEAVLNGSVDSLSGFGKLILEGKMMIGKLDKDVRAKIEFISTGIHKHYDAFKVTIMNRTEGAIDISVLKFGDIIGLKDGATPYFWDDRNCNGWYGFRPTAAEYDKISDTIHDYMSMYASEDIGYEMRTM